MILLIDAGNTRVKLAWINPGETTRTASPVLLEYDSLEALPDCVPIHPGRILGSNVAGHAVGTRLEHSCQRAWGMAIEWCRATQGQALLRNGYTHPDQLGTDRWLGLLGMLRHLRQAARWRDTDTPCILASFGTATTVDTLALTRPTTGTRGTWGAPGPTPPTFVGGLILPGYTLMSQSLATGTAQLPLASGPCSDFPQDTRSAIASGIVAAQEGALLRQWRLAFDLGRRPPHVFVTGGSWDVLREDLCRVLARAHRDRTLAAVAPQWLEAPVLDGLAWLSTQPGADGQPG